MGLFSAALPAAAAAAVVPPPTAGAAVGVATLAPPTAVFACSTDAITLAPTPQPQPLDRCDAAFAAVPANAAAATAAAAASLAASASAPTVACPAPRPTLASTAALFIPDKHSPILLAPSESEIQSDPGYYRFGAQLVAALVLFFVAYTLAYVILGAVRRRERRAKAALKAALRKEAAQDDATTTLTRLQQRRHARNDSSSGFQSSGGSGGGPGTSVVRPRLYVVQPALPQLRLIRSSVSLDLSDLTPVPTRLQRLQRRVRASLDWVLGWPARWRRRRRARAKQAEQMLQHQLHRARRSSMQAALSASSAGSSSSSSSGTASSSVPPSSSDSTPISKARRMSTTIAAFLKRAGAHPSAASALSHAPALSSVSPDGTMVSAPSPEQIERDAAFATSQLLASFATPLPWLSPHLPDTPPSSSSPPVHQAQAPSSFRNRAASISSISDTISSWTAAAFSTAGGGGTPTASPLKGPSPVPLSLLSPLTSAQHRQNSRDGSAGSSRYAASAASFSASSPSSSSALSPISLPSPSSRSSFPVAHDALDSDAVSPRDHDASSSSVVLGGGAHDDFPDEENEREFLTYSLATFVVCVALVWIELLVLSVLASGTGSASAAASMAHGAVNAGGLTSLNQLYLFSWCTKDLVTVLWTGTVWLSSVSLFILAPFAFLYFEAEGILGRRGTLSRVAETVCVLSAFTVALYGSFHLLHAIIGMDVTSTNNASSSEDPVVLIPDSFWSDLWGSSHSSPQFAWVSWGWALSWLGGVNLESLYSNIWHFLPGLLMLLLTCHNGFIELIAFAYRRAAAVDLPSPLAAAQDLKLTQRLNAIKCEMATLQRKWDEMHDETLALRMQMQARAEAARARSAGFSRRAIAPSSPSAYSSSPQPFSGAPSFHSKKALLARLDQLQVWHAECSRELRPLNWTARLRASPYVRNSGWLLLTICALLFTWHIILRVAQREARLIFRGSIFRWFRDPVLFFETAQGGPDSEQSSWALIRALWWTLASLKSTLGTVLSLLTGKVLGNKNAAAAASSIAALTPPLAAPVAMIPAAAPLFDSPFLSTLLDLFRVLCSMLLGINGFQHPGVAFLADVGVIAFLLLASATHVYSAPALARFSPLAALQLQVERAQKAAKKRDGARSSGGDGEQEEDEDKLVADSSDSAALLFSAQFFTVNAVIFLLLASSLPIATWMLGLSSFDLFEFYPQSAVQLAAADVRSLHPPVVGGGSFFLHLYNLTFLALTGWHITQISKQIVVWVLVEQLLGTVEVIVERARVRLGYSKPNASPAERFVMFGAWRRRRMAGGGAEMTRLQALVYVARQVWAAARFLLAPLVRGAWFLLRRASCLLMWMGRHAWEAVTAFLLSELSDEEDVQRDAEAAAAASRASPSPSPIPAIAESPIDSHHPLLLHARAESSLTSQLLAEVDAVSAAGRHDGPLLEDGAAPFTLTLPPGPSPLRPVHRRSFARNGGSTLGLTSSSFALFARSLSAPPVGGSHGFSEGDSEADTPSLAFGVDSAATTPMHDGAVQDATAAFVPGGGSEDDVGSPLYRSRTAARSSTAAAAFFQTPGLVPSFSRKLSVSTHSGENDSAAEAGSSPVSDSSESGHSPLSTASMLHSGSSGRLLLSDTDFPLVYTPQQLRSIDEDGRGFGGGGFAHDESGDSSAAPSNASSAAPTPHRSPLFTPHQHRSHSLAELDSMLHLGSAGSSPTTDSSPTPSSHSSASSTPLSWPSSSLSDDARLRSHQSLRSSGVMRLEPTLEESHDSGALDESSGANSSVDSDSSMHGETALVAAQLAAAAVAGGLASQSTSSESDEAECAD